MRRRPVDILSILVLTWTLGLTALEGPSAGQVRPTPAPAQAIPSDDAAIVHALNRLGYGPRPGDVERIREVGLQSYLEQQLRPGMIQEDEVEARLESLSTVEMTPVELLVAYPPPPFVKALGRRLERGMGMDAAAVGDLFPEMDRRERARPIIELGQGKLIRAVYSERQLEQILVDFWFNHFNVYVGKGADRWLTASYEREAVRPHAMGRFRELLGAVARHPAMLFYLDNWTSAATGVEFDRRDMEPYAGQAIRGQGLPPGGVATLVLRERGMDTSAIEQGIERRQRYGSRSARGRLRFDDPDEARRRGLNENYARELLELHTLGVDEGYTQQDVIEVARCFTGWTLLPLHAGQGYVFVDELHDRGKKVVLGRTIRGRGEAEGEAVLDLLAAHPSTARFISTKLARRFVSDDPPESLIERVTTRFIESDGDIPSALRVLFYSEEFVTSALRATGADLDGGPGALHVLRQMGQPPYGAQPPTRYDDTAEAWVSTGALLDRMKFALGLAAGRIPGAVVVPPATVSTVTGVEEQILASARRLLGREPSTATVEAIAGQFEDPEVFAALGPAAIVLRSEEGRERLTVGWVLASAEFQRK
jgi:uncharacterized protein (DUF1800 family)